MTNEKWKQVREALKAEFNAVEVAANTQGVSVDHPLDNLSTASPFCIECGRHEDDHISTDPRAARIAELEAALRGMMALFPHEPYDNERGGFAPSTVTAYAAAKRALNPSIELNLSDKETE